MMNDETVISEETLEVSEDVLATPEEASGFPLESNEAPNSSADAENTEPIEVTEAPCCDEKEDTQLLRTELDALRHEIEEKKKVFERMSREIGEFSEVFPERSVSEIPDSVWESVKTGIPLAAAYALYERKNALRADTACRINERNGATTTGPVGRASTENFYTPDEVRKMTREEVKQNYSKILESMKKWN